MQVREKESCVWKMPTSQSGRARIDRGTSKGRLILIREKCREGSLFLYIQSRRRRGRGKSLPATSDPGPASSSVKEGMCSKRDCPRRRKGRAKRALKDARDQVHKPVASRSRILSQSQGVLRSRRGKRGGGGYFLGPRKSAGKRTETVQRSNSGSSGCTQNSAKQ